MMRTYEKIIIERLDQFGQGNTGLEYISIFLYELSKVVSVLDLYIGNKKNLKYSSWWAGIDKNETVVLLTACRVKDPAVTLEFKVCLHLIIYL